MLILRRLRLALAIVGRVNQADYRTGPRLAWRIACIVYPSPRACRWPACSCLPKERCPS